MNEKTQKLLFDIKKSIELIQIFTKTISSYPTYCKDKKTKSTVERQLAIIGEAINKISKTDSSVKIANARMIIGLRNRIIHAYDSVDDTIIWAIIKNHLAELYD